jgi:hypothetical protein
VPGLLPTALRPNAGTKPEMAKAQGRPTLPPPHRTTEAHIFYTHRGRKTHSGLSPVQGSAGRTWSAPEAQLRPCESRRA